MKKLFTGLLLLAIWGVIPACATLAAPTPSAPATGFIHTVRYGTDKEGKPVGQKRYERVWFSGHNTHHEELIGDQLATVSVSGDSSWSALVGAGRIMEDDAKPIPPSTYPERIRQSFARFFSKRPIVAEEVVQGHPCWKYSWHEAERNSGDIGFPAHDVSYWVYANKEFPVTLRYESSLGARLELVQFKLNSSVPAGLFAKPKGLLAIQPFTLPSSAFTIELETVRVSTKYGWKKSDKETFTGDGQRVTHTFTGIHAPEQGADSTFAPPAKVLTYPQAQGELWRRLQTPTWFAVKKIGKEPIMNFTADLLEGIVEGLPKQQSWVVDHPTLGTISLRRRTEYPGDVTDIQVTRIHIGSPAKP